MITSTPSTWSVRAPLTAAPADVLRADGYVLGTPANIGYMSGALKHFFDGIYYPCLEATRRRPYGLYVHGGSDTAGAVPAGLRIVRVGTLSQAITDLESIKAGKSVPSC